MARASYAVVRFHNRLYQCRDVDKPLKMSMLQQTLKDKVYLALGFKGLVNEDAEIIAILIERGEFEILERNVPFKERKGLPYWSVLHIVADFNAPVEPTGIFTEPTP